jgi:3-oxoacyl-[acyl-carrier-protein] synthase III
MNRPCDEAMFNRIEPKISEAINAAIVDRDNPETVASILTKLGEVLAFEAGVMLAGLVETGNAKEGVEVELIFESFVETMRNGAAVRRPKREPDRLAVFRAMLPKD